MSATTIQWTDKVWNPVRGCSRVSRGCEHCYAERIAARFSGPGQPFYGFATDRSIIPGSPRGGVAGRWTGDVELVPEKLEEPLHWKKPRRVFVDSMSDLFHEKLSNEDISRVFDVMNRASQHTFQVLTKRPARMFAWADGGLSAGAWPALNIRPSPNVWLGVSVEDQKTADKRIPLLLQTPAALRFVSYEPALGPVDFDPWLGYNPVHETTTGRGSLRGGEERRTGDRPGRANLADSEARVGSLEAANGNAAVSPGARRERHRRLPDDSRDVGQPARVYGSASSRLSSFQGADPSGPDGESRQREQEGQPTEESCAGNLYGTGTACAARARNVEGEGTGRRGERYGEAESGSREGDSSSASGGREAEVDSRGLRNDGSQRVANRAATKVGLDLVIVGGESGPGARPCDLAWIRSAVAQCKEAGVPCFVKQLGARPFDRTGTSGFQCAYGSDGFVGLRLRNRKGGNPAEWPKDLRVREWPGR